jgi:hypothetical protein
VEPHLAMYNNYVKIQSVALAARELETRKKEEIKNLGSLKLDTHAWTLSSNDICQV